MPRIFFTQNTISINVFIITFFKWSIILLIFYASKNINAALNIPIIKIAARRLNLFLEIPPRLRLIISPALRIIRIMQISIIRKQSHYLLNR